MLDVFTEEDEVLIKDGIANLYWFRNDLKKAWLRAGVEDDRVKRLFGGVDSIGNRPTKRQLMDLLYEDLRGEDFNRRLRVSRNFVRTLVEQRSFIRQDEKHKVEKAERAALKLRERIAAQETEREQNRRVKELAAKERRDNYEVQRALLYARFLDSERLKPQPRGVAAYWCQVCTIY